MNLMFYLLGYVILGPKIFQRLMNILLAGIQRHDCLVHLDDIIVLG